MIEPGARFDLEQTIEERRDGELVGTRRARVELAIGADELDGTYAAEAVVVFGGEDVSEQRVVLDLHLGPDLALRAAPIARCAGRPRNDEASQLVRHVLQAVPRPLPTIGAGHLFEGEIWSEHGDGPSDARARLQAREPGRVRITADAELTMSGERIAGALVTGTAHVRVIAELDDSLLAGTTRTRIEADGAFRDRDAADTTPRVARLRIDERIVAVRGARRTFGITCEEEDPRSAGAFDARLVVQMIEARQAPIGACYEDELRVDRSAAGMMRVRRTVLEDGALGAVEVIENTTGRESLAACVVGVLSRPFRFAPGPVGGSVTFHFPFVFEPAR